MTAPRLQNPDMLIAALIALLTAALFAQTATFDFVNYDDDLYVYKNPSLQNGLTVDSVIACFTRPIASNWHPLTMLSHTLDAELFGISPHGPHAVNVLLHAVNAGLLFVAIMHLTEKRWAAAVCSLLFACHPLRVESVAWISERKDVLSGLFFMLTLIAYARYCAAPSVRRYATVLLALAGGLLSKPMLVSAPFVLLLLDVWPLRRMSTTIDRRRAFVEKLPMLFLVAIFCLAAIYSQAGGRSMAGWNVLPLGDRLLNAAHATGNYLYQFIWPANLTPIYYHPYLAPRDGLPVDQLVAAFIALAVLTTAAILLRRRAPWMAVGWCWFVGMLVPVIGIIQVGFQAHADRYTYLPGIGIAILVAFSLDGWCAAHHRRRKCFSAVIAVVVIALSTATISQTHHWRDSRSLWTHAVGVEPNSIALNNLGSALTAAGENDLAMRTFERAIAVNPRAAEAMKNLAVHHISRGEDTAARALLRDALTADPNLIEAYSNLAGIYLRASRPDDAMKLYRLAVKRDPNFADGFYNLGVTLAQQGRFEEAIPYLQRAVELRPGDSEARRDLTAASELAAKQSAARNIPATQPNE